uniref:LOC100145303 protein n=1 Tax=Xenopus tropicalis TaxID=8364 RepID=B1H146_XENTR|nr:LOC100145303 protein [Xenopus tropicalis]
MATGGGPPDEALSDQDLPNWSHESLDDRLNNMDWKGQKKANRSTEKNKKKFVECDLRLTNDISPESSPGVGRRRARTPHTFPHTRYVSQMSVPEQAELEKLKQKINFSDLDQRSIGSDSQGRATAANNKRQLADNRKPFNFLPLQLNTNKEKSSKSPPKRESSTISSTKDFLASAFNKDFLSNSQAFLEEESQREPSIDSSQVVSRLVQIRDYITKASSLRDDLVEKNDLSANIDRLSNLIEHLKFQEKSYLKFLQKMLGVDPQQEAKEELKNMKKQHALLTRMLQQQEQLRALKGRQAALLALQHKAEQTIAKMDESVVTETTGSVSGLSLASELNEELNDLIQRFHNQLHDSEDPPVPDNRRQAESLSLAREVYRSRNSSSSDTPLEEKSPLFNKVGVLLEKKQKMDTLLGELHTLHDQHLNNTAFMASSVSPRRSTDQRTLGCAISAALSSDNRAANSPITVGTYQAASVNESEDENEEEENYEFEARPVDVQTSLETSSEIADETEKEEMESRPEADIETEKTLSLAVHEMGELSIHEDQLKSDSDVLPHSSLLLSNGNTTDFSGTAPVNVKSPVDSPGTSGAGSSDTESPVLVNDFETGSGNLSQKSDEDDFVKVEDLPLKLTMPMPKEQIMKEMEEEEKKNNLCDEILNTSDEGNGADQLAGDPGALKEPVPDSPGINSA